jgi:hypothetical protein
MEGPFAEGFLYRPGNTLAQSGCTCTFGFAWSLRLFSGVQLVEVRQLSRGEVLRNLSMVKRFLLTRGLVSLPSMGQSTPRSVIAHG